MIRRFALLLPLALACSGCGYFNSFYNAQRRFAEAERAAQRGELQTASTAYNAAVEKAAISYRKHPDSRWADDALLLIGRARYGLRQYDAARAALGRVLEQSRDDELRAVADLYLGASLAALGHPDSALAPLGRALQQLERESREHDFALLWQGRARLALGQEGGWADLEAAARRDDALGVEAALEAGSRALQAGQPERAGRALARLLAMRATEARADSVSALVGAARERWDARTVLGWLPEHVAETWSAETRSRIQLAHARLTADAGDTAAALRVAVRAAQQSSGDAGAAARFQAARWMLGRMERAEDLPQVRAVLLPAIASPDVVREIRRLRALEILLERARAGQSAGLFAAAELARDSLAAPRLARSLFLAYADVAASGVWAPKALLAALALSTEEQRPPLVTRLDAAPANPYVAAVRGRADSAAFRAAEERLGRAVAALSADATAEALAGDVRITRAVTVLDSLRVSARTDSLRIRCGGLLDSLALRGIRSDSVRAACMRSDGATLTRYLAIDTMLLRGRTAADSAARRATVQRDTLRP